MPYDSWGPLPTGPTPDLLVFGLDEVQRAHAFRPDATLSLLCAGKPAPRFEGAHLVLRMEDIEDEVPDAPSLSDAILIVAFLRAYADGARVAIHCHAGVSRSASAALALLHLRGLPAKALAPTLAVLRPEARPNRRLAALLDQALSLRGTLVRAANALHDPRCL